jgi:hypothetical protein
MRWWLQVPNMLRAMVWLLVMIAGMAVAADPPGSMSAYGLKPSTPQSEQQASPQPEYVFPELEEPERNPWSGVPQEPHGSPQAPGDRSLNPWLGGNMPTPPDTTAPPSRYAPEDHRELLMERPMPGYDRQDAYGRPGYDRSYEHGYPGTYPGYGGYGGYGYYGYGTYDPLLSPYGAGGYPGYGYGNDGYPGTGAWGLPFMGSPFDLFF